MSQKAITSYDSLDPVNGQSSLEKERKRSKWRLGLLFIVIGIVTWVAAIIIINQVLKNDEFKKPFLISYIVGSLFSVYLVPDLIRYIKSKISATSHHGSEIVYISGDRAPLLPDAIVKATTVFNVQTLNIQEQVSSELSVREVMELSALLATIYFVYNIFSMASLQFTSASNTSILSTTTSIFTLVLGVFLKVETFSFTKVSSIIISIVGIVLITLGTKSAKIEVSALEDDYTPANPILGNFMSCIAAFFYSSYLLVMKYYCNDNKTTNERQLFGYVGIFTFVGGLPILFLANITGFESFVLPTDKTTIAVILINAFFTIVSDYSFILAMLFTSPLITSLSLTAGIPLTMICDSIFYGSTNSGFTYYMGMVLILLSFIAINMSGDYQKKESTIDDESIEQTGLGVPDDQYAQNGNVITVSQLLNV